MTGAKLISTNPVGLTVVQKEQQSSVDFGVPTIFSRWYVVRLNNGRLNLLQPSYYYEKNLSKNKGTPEEMKPRKRNGGSGSSDIVSVPASNCVSARFTFFLNQLSFFSFYFHPKEYYLRHMVTAKFNNKKSRSTYQNLCIIIHNCII